MRVLESNQKHLLLQLYIPFFTLGLLLFVFAPHVLHACFTIHSLLLIAVIAIALSPLGAKQFKKEKISTSKWIGFTLLFQSALFAFAVGMQGLITHVLPINVPEHAATLNSMHQWLLEWSLFPWGYYLLVAVSLGLVLQREKVMGALSQALIPVFKHKEEDDIGVCCDFSNRVYIFSGFAFVVTLFLLALIGSAASILKLNLHPSIGLMLVTMLLFFATNSKGCNDWIHQMKDYLKMPWQILLLMLTVISAVFIGLFYAITQSIFTELLTPVATVSNHAWHIKASLVMGQWWLAVMPFAISVILTLGRGRSVRQVIAMNLALPILLALIISAKPFPPMNTVLVSLCMLFGFSVFLGFVFREAHIENQKCAILPGTCNLKPRNLTGYYHLLLRGVVMLLVLYCLGGVIGFGAILSGITVEPTILYLFIPLALFPSKNEFFRIFMHSKSLSPNPSPRGRGEPD